MTKMFGPTRCSEILSEKCLLWSKQNRSKVTVTFNKYAKIIKATKDIKDLESRRRIIDALKREAKHTVYNDLIIDDDTKQRLYYCICFLMNKSLT